MKQKSQSSEHENTKNVLVILLGWNGANPRHLSKYNRLYDNYEDYIGNKNKNNDKPIPVNIIVKQYIAPIHYTLLNFCLLHKISSKILDSIKSHRESFGSSSRIIIHSFSTAGTLILSSMNQLIWDKYQRKGNKRKETREGMERNRGTEAGKRHRNHRSRWQEKA